MITPVGVSRKAKWRAIGGSPGQGKEYVVAAAVPTSSDSKPVIVAWLLAHGVSFTEAALLNMAVDELIDLVHALLDNP